MNQRKYKWIVIAGAGVALLGAALLESAGAIPIPSPLRHHSSDSGKFPVQALSADGIALDSLLVGFSPGKDHTYVEEVARNINGSVEFFDPDHTALIRVPRQPTTADIYRLAEKVRLFPGVRFAKPPALQYPQ